MRKKLLDPASRLSLLYITALSAIGVVALISQIIIRTNIQSQKYDGKIVNTSGRQRMLSQRLTKDFLLLERAAEHDNARQTILRRIQDTHQEWSMAHYFLSDQTDNQGRKINNSQVVRDMFQHVQPFFDSINHACVSITEAPLQDTTSQIAESLQIILNAEPHFLNHMEKITDQFAIEAAGKVVYLERIELILFLITISILAIESMFILLPAVQKLRQYFQQLLEANHSLEMAAETIRESQQLLLRSSLETQERERKRIAMELHDGLGPLIALAKMNINHLEGKVPVEDAKFAEKSLECLDEIHKSIRQISNALIPYTLEQFGLKIALENLIEEMQAGASIEIKLYVDIEQENFGETFELNAYRLVQELLNNALRHAEASEISVQVFTDDFQMVIMIEDDGKGLTLNNPLKSTGLGLKNMMSRVNAFNGHLNIDANPRDGTTITVYLPIPSQNGTY